MSKKTHKPTGRTIEHEAAIRAIGITTRGTLGKDYAILDVCLEAIKQYEALRSET